MKKEIFTIPNILTFLRFALVPVLVIVYLNYYQSQPFLPPIIFLIAALTDVADGYIARKFNMETDIGKVLDPLADKLFILAMLVCFTIKQPTFIISTLLIISLAKELYMVVAASLLYRRKLVVQSRHIGKIAAFALNTGVFLYFFISYGTVIRIVAEVTLLLGLVLSLSAAVYYTLLVYKQTGGRLPPK